MLDRGVRRRRRRWRRQSIDRLEFRRSAARGASVASELSSLSLSLSLSFSFSSFVSFFLSLFFLFFLSSSVHSTWLSVSLFCCAFYRVLPGFTGFYRVFFLRATRSDGFIGGGFHWVLPSFYRVPTRFDQVLRIFCEFYRVLLGFTGFYRVLSDYVGLY